MPGTVGRRPGNALTTDGEEQKGGRESGAVPAAAAATVEDPSTVHCTLTTDGEKQTGGRESARCARRSSSYCRGSSRVLCTVYTMVRG